MEKKNKFLTLFKDYNAVAIFLLLLIVASFAVQAFTSNIYRVIQEASIYGLIAVVDVLYTGQHLGAVLIVERDVIVADFALGAGQLPRVGQGHAAVGAMKIAPLGHGYPQIMDVTTELILHTCTRRSFRRIFPAVLSLR